MAPAPRARALPRNLIIATAVAAVGVLAVASLVAPGVVIPIAQRALREMVGHLLKKNDGQVNWNQTATTIDRQIRALNPWPGVWAQTQEGQRLKILTAQLAETTAQSTETLPTSTALAEKDRPVGMLLDKAGHVQCGQGTILCLQRIQPAGKQAMDLPAALNGGYLKIGEILT